MTVSEVYGRDGENVGGRVLRAALDFLLPAPCLGCGAPGSGGHLGLCLPCRGRLRPPPTPACRRCGTEIRAQPPPGDSLCGDCRRRPPAHERLLVAWRFEPPLVDVVHGLKFRRLDYLARHLAAGIHDSLGQELQNVDLVVPVPLHWLRRLRRGYNQAELIARPLSQSLERPWCRGLVRRRPTPPQSGLPRSARIGNVRGAFLCPRPQRIRGRKLLLVDDVVTTGSTLGAAARALVRAGASSVTALAVARTPEP